MPYETRDNETGTVHAWTPEAIARHQSDEVGDLSHVATALAILARNGMDVDVAAEAYIEDVFADHEEAIYDLAKERLSQELDGLKLEAA